MAKELSKVGIVTGNDIKAPHVTQSVDAFTGLDAYDITISGSLEVTGSISTDSTVYANALNLEGGNIQYYPADDLLKFGDNITLGVGAGVSGFASDIEIKSDGNEGYITSNISNLTLQSGGGDTIIRNTKSGKNIILQPDATSGGASGGVLISGSSPNVSLDVRGPITGSSNISASGYLTANNITSSANISASGYIIGEKMALGNNPITPSIPVGGLYSTAIINTSYIQTSTLTATNSSTLGVATATSLSSGGDITQTSADSILTLGSRGDIRVGINDFLNTSTSIQQINLNPTQNHEETVTMYAGINKGINLREKSTLGVVTSSLDITNFSGNSTYGSIAMNWDATLNHGDTFYIINTVTEGNGGGVTHFGNNVASKFVSVYGKGSTQVNGYWGLRVASGGALQLLSDQAYKPIAGQWAATSDLRLKENIVTASIDLCYDGVKNLPLKYFTWKDEIMEERPLDGSVLGWIAQDVKKVFPKAVQTGSFTTFSTFTGSAAITGSNGETILKPGGRYQDVLAGSEIIEDRHTLQADQITKMMYGAIQKLQEKVEALEAQISGSNS